jgi:SAM-dependent methyltransferase
MADRPAATEAAQDLSYDRIAAQWDAARTGYGRLEREYLDRLCAPLASGATVLDLGCGTGRPFAEDLLGRGWRVVGVDASAAQLAIARARCPNGVWIEARLEDYAFDTACDAAVCWDTLFHVERRHHQAIFARLARRLPAGGRLMLTCGGSAHPPFTDEMFGRAFFYDSHPPDVTLSLLLRAGFRILRAEFLNLPPGTRDLRDKGRFAILAERAA